MKEETVTIEKSEHAGVTHEVVRALERVCIGIAIVHNAPALGALHGGGVDASEDV